MPKKYTSEELKEFKEKSKLLEPIMRGEFLEQFEFLVDFIKGIKNTNSNEFGSFKKTLNDFTNQANSDKTTNLQTLKNEIINLNRKVDTRLASLRDGRDGEAGRDADEENIVNKVLPRIKLPEMPNIKKDIPKLGEPIRDSLELLQGDSRLDINAISGLKKALKGLRKKAGVRLGGGGTSYIGISRHFIDPYVPTGTLNGVNKAFTLTKTPNPTASLKVYVS